jgi:hypothetical protein
MVSSIESLRLSVPNHRRYLSAVPLMKKAPKTAVFGARFPTQQLRGMLRNFLAPFGNRV